MSGSTKLLRAVISDADAGRITHDRLFEILQEAIDNGDILLESNELYVVGTVLPFIDQGFLKRSEYVDEFEA